MADDTSNRRPADRLRVNVNEPWELSYWMKEFRCTAEELRAAVKAAGVMVADVQAYLRTKL